MKLGTYPVVPVSSNTITSSILNTAAALAICKNTMTLYIVGITTEV